MLQEGFSRLSQRKGLPHGLYMPGYLASVQQAIVSDRILRICNILSETSPLIDFLIPLSSSVAAISKAFTLLPWKSDRNNTDIGERHQSHSVNFDKCLQCC